MTLRGKRKGISMPNATPLRLTPKALLVAFVSACYPLAGLAAVAGKVEFSIGNVTAVGTDGRSRSLTKGEEISTGDTIQTGNGRTQVRFTDGGYISLMPNTEFKVNDYNYSGKADGTEKGFFGLVKGGLRALTGAIGHTNKKTYLVNTPVATIGIRGTEFLATMDDKLMVRVGDGAVYIANDKGDIVLYKGQSGEVDGPDSAPQYTNDEPLVNAAGPSGGTPLAFQQEYKLQQPDQTSYVAGRDTTPGGVSCELVGGCVTSSTSNMQYLAANNLIGTYSISSLSPAATTGSTTLAVPTGSMTANFGTGSISLSLTIPNSIYFVNGATGSITGNSLSASGINNVTFPAISFNATGSFFGSNAAQAGINYKFTSGTTTAGGNAILNQTSLHP